MNTIRLDVESDLCQVSFDYALELLNIRATKKKYADIALHIHPKLLPEAGYVTKTYAGLDNLKFKVVLRDYYTEKEWAVEYDGTKIYSEGA